MLIEINWKMKEKVHSFLFTKWKIQFYISIHSNQWLIRYHATWRSQLPVRPCKGVSGADATTRNMPPLVILPRLLAWLRPAQGWGKSITLRAPLLLSGRCSGQRPPLTPSRGRPAGDVNVIHGPFRHPAHSSALLNLSPLPFVLARRWWVFLFFPSTRPEVMSSSQSGDWGSRWRPSVYSACSCAGPRRVRSCNASSAVVH